MLNIKVVTWSLAIWTAFSYVFCINYGLVIPSGTHMTAFLIQILPGSNPTNGKAFLWD